VKPTTASRELAAWLADGCDQSGGEGPAGWRATEDCVERGRQLRQPRSSWQQPIADEYCFDAGIASNCLNAWNVGHQISSRVVFALVLGFWTGWFDDHPWILAALIGWSALLLVEIWIEYRHWKAKRNARKKAQG
jgi:hypothetical protein